MRSRPQEALEDLLTATTEVTGTPATLVDDLSFSNRAVVAWTVMSFGYFRPAVLEGRLIGPPGRTPSTARRYLLLRLSALEPLRDRLPALAELAGRLGDWATGRLGDEIVRRWPEAADPPTYPAFR